MLMKEGWTRESCTVLYIEGLVFSDSSWGNGEVEVYSSEDAQLL